MQSLRTWSLVDWHQMNGNRTCPYKTQELGLYSFGEFLACLRSHAFLQCRYGMIRLIWRGLHGKCSYSAQSKAGAILWWIMYVQPRLKGSQPPFSHKTPHHSDQVRCQQHKGCTNNNFIPEEIHVLDTRLATYALCDSVFTKVNKE
jgi:hypothetical protein